MKAWAVKDIGGPIHLWTITDKQGFAEADAEDWNKRCGGQLNPISAEPLPTRKAVPVEITELDTNGERK